MPYRAMPTRGLVVPGRRCSHLRSFKLWDGEKRVGFGAGGAASCPTPGGVPVSAVMISRRA